MDDDRWLLELYRNARELPIGEFQESAIQLIQSKLSFDSGMWGSGLYTEQEGLILNSVHLHNQPIEMLQSYDLVRAVDPAVHFSAKNTNGAQSFSAKTQLSPRNYAALSGHTRRFDMEHALVLVHTDEANQTSDIISLWRADQYAPYDHSEDRIGTCLISHVIEAGSINRALWLSKSESGTERGHGGKAVATFNGSILAQESDFCECLRLEWPDWNAAWLPLELVDSLRNTLEPQFIGRNITVYGSARENMLFLRATGEHPISPLTKAQQNVVTRLAKGLSYKEIAKELGLSPATVRNHIHAIYKKLGIRNKVELAQYIHNKGLR